MIPLIQTNKVKGISTLDEDALRACQISQRARAGLGLRSPNMGRLLHAESTPG